MQITTLFQIGAILFFGTIGDIVATWFFNAPVLMWYLEKKEQNKKH
jgi:preprotein translocase subunit SecF